MATCKRGRGSVRFSRIPSADYIPLQHPNQSSKPDDVSAVSETTLELESTSSPAKELHSEEASPKEHRPVNCVAGTTGLYCKMYTALLLYMLCTHVDIYTYMLCTHVDTYTYTIQTYNVLAYV